VLAKHYDTLWPLLDEPRLQHWHEQLAPDLTNALNPVNNGNLPRWLEALETIATFPSNQPFDISQALITTASNSSLSEQHKIELKNALKAFHPWRKGPFSIHDIFIDTEWRSDWKWERVLPNLTSLENKRVLDIGCGSGYHLWRMCDQKPSLAIGVDPSLLFMCQFLALKHFIGEDVPTYFLPLTLEQLPKPLKGGAFDTVFSMGVLYHRRSPIDHIYDLKSQLAPGGELVLETLVIPEEFGQLLVPKDRYAQMRNVWFLPSISELQRWLERCGLVNVRCVDINQTSVEEQRATEWMEWNSLKDFLDPNDPSKTIEGYPAPLRAVMVCNTSK
jgi:tRNA (mo5U34)-methyltransferase